LNPEELARAQVLLAEFTTNQPQYTGLELLESYPDDGYILTVKACKLFQVEVVLYRPVPTLHGVTEGNCVLLSGYGNETGDRKPFWIAGHEVSHVLGLRQPDEHKNLVSYVMRKCVLADAFERRSRIEKLARGLLRPFVEEPVPEGWDEIVNDEIVADIAGNLWQDSRFWADVYERDVNADRRAIYMEIMTRLEVEKPKSYRPWALDTDRVRERFVDYTLLFLQR
jgi:hypothetical protein